MLNFNRSTVLLGKKTQYSCPILQNESQIIAKSSLKNTNLDGFAFNTKKMGAKIITTEDLREFKMELLDDIKTLLTKQTKGTIKRYLKSSEVRDLLQVSSGTLQNLRINGTLPYTKVGGIIYYDIEEIQNLMTANRVQRGLNS